MKTYITKGDLKATGLLDGGSWTPRTCLLAQNAMRVAGGDKRVLTGGVGNIELRDGTIVMYDDSGRELQYAFDEACH